MRPIDADDLYQKCIDIQCKKKNRYFDIDDVIKLIKKAPAAYKGMTNGEVIKTVFSNVKLKVYCEEISKLTEEDTTYYLDWWNSPYEPQERSE